MQLLPVVQHLSCNCCLLCRNGIEGLNDELLTRGFAVNEEGGIPKVTALLLPILDIISVQHACQSRTASHQLLKQTVVYVQ